MKLIASSAGENVPKVPMPTTLRMIVVISAPKGNSNSTRSTLCIGIGSRDRSRIWIGCR